MKPKILRIETKEQRTEAKNFVDAYHSYIRWADRPSRKIYWALYEDDLVGIFGLSSAFARPKVIAEFMEQHNIAFNEMANNIVYCLHGNTAPGTQFLAICRKDAVKWWKERYDDELKCFQTFILPPRTGAMYKADNWKCIGETAGKEIYAKTLYGEDREKYTDNVEIRTFKNGQTQYIYRERRVTEKKLIFVRLAAIKKEYNQIGREIIR